MKISLLALPEMRAFVEDIALSYACQ